MRSNISFRFDNLSRQVLPFQTADKDFTQKAFSNFQSRSSVKIRFQFHGNIRGESHKGTRR